MDNKVEVLTWEEIEGITEDWLRKQKGDHGIVEPVIEHYYNIYSYHDIRDVIDPDHPAMALLTRRTIDLLREHDSSGNWKNKYPISCQDVSHSGDFWQQLLFPMIAYGLESSQHFHDQRLKTAIIERIRFGNAYLRRESIDKLKNWWASDIGIPRNILKILFLDIHHEIIPRELKATMIKYVLYIGFNPQSMGFNTDMKKGMLNLKTGMNMLWVNYALFQTGILLSRLDFVRVGCENINQIISISERWTGDGIAPDGSFHQHCLPKMTGINMGYGGSFVETASMYIYIMSILEQVPSVDVSLGPETIRDFGKLLEFLLWNTWGNGMNYWTKGRALSRHHSMHRMGGYPDILDHALPLLFTNYSGLCASLRLAVDHRRKHSVGLQFNHPFPQPVYFASKLEARSEASVTSPVADEIVSAGISGVKHFPHGRLLVSKDDDHLVAVQLNDKHHKTYFSIHGENKRGYHLNEGSIYYITPKIGTDTDSQYAYPWDRVLGTTNIADKHAIKEISARSRRLSAGSIGSLGTIGFQFNQNGIKGLKSYHILEGLLFLIGSGIKRKFEWRLKYRKSPMTTTIYSEPHAKSRLNQDEGRVFYASEKDIGLKILHLKNFPDDYQDPVKIVHETIRINPRDLNKKYAPVNPTEALCTWNLVQLNHGLKPRNQEYCCVLGFGVEKPKFLNSLNDWDIRYDIREHGHGIMVTIPNESDATVKVEATSVFFTDGDIVTGGMDRAGTLLWSASCVKISGNKKISCGGIRVFVSVETTGNILKKPKFPITTAIKIPLLLDNVPPDGAIESVSVDRRRCVTTIKVKIKDLMGTVIRL